MRLILEQQIVHLPESSLPGRRLRREQRMRVRVLQREMAEYEADLVREPLEQQLRRLHRHLAGGALEIPIFDQRHRRMLGAERMIGGLRRGCQSCRMRGCRRHVETVYASRAGNSIGCTDSESTAARRKS